jgi:nitroreductase
MDLIEIMKNRRSVRKYTSEPVEQQKINQILQAGLLSASGRAKRPWEFIVVTEHETLEKLSHCRQGSAKMLDGAGAAIIVIGNTEKADTWIEDCSIAMSNMHLMAANLGLGSCWIQGRMRESEQGIPTDEFVRSIIGYPENFSLEAILSIGCIDVSPEGYSLDSLEFDKVHYEKF